LNFNLKQIHNWGIEEIENLWPWEREIYVALLKQHIDEENERMKQRMSKNGR